MSSIDVGPLEQQVGRDQARRVAEATGPGELARIVADVCDEITHGIPFVSLANRIELTTRLAAVLQGTALVIRLAAQRVDDAERAALRAPKPTGRPGAKGRKKKR
jgi:hypothetical protein